MNDMHKLPHYSYWLLFGLIFLSTGIAVASGAEFTDFVISNSRSDLLLSLSLSDVFTEEVKKAVRDGISFTIVFSITLYRVHNFWFDKKIVRKTTKNTIKYDLLKIEYKVKRSWDSRSPLVVQSLDNAQKLMTEVNNLKVTHLNELEEGRKYQLRAKAVCKDQIKLLFGPSWSFKTDWYTVDFVY